jgi:hypothetical protein
MKGVEGLTHDKTRPSRIPPLPAETIDRVVALTNQEPSHEATHWTAPAMAKAERRLVPTDRCAYCVAINRPEMSSRRQL